MLSGTGSFGRINLVPHRIVIGLLLELFRVTFFRWEVLIWGIPVYSC